MTTEAETRGEMLQLREERAHFYPMSRNALCSLGKMNMGAIYRQGWVEGNHIADMMLETGCSRTLVHSELVPREKILEGSVTTICCAHSDTLLYPLAELEIQVADTLPIYVGSTEH